MPSENRPRYRESPGGVAAQRYKAPTHPSLILSWFLPLNAHLRAGLSVLLALLFFTLGISVVAIPISPIISDISPRGEPGEHEIDGLWVLHHSEYLSGDPATTYMKIINGATVGIWPLPYGKPAAEELFASKVWLRETSDLKLRASMPSASRPPEEMFEGFGSTTHSYGLLLANSIKYSDGTGSESHPESITAKFTPEPAKPASKTVQVGIQTKLWKPMRPRVPPVLPVK